MELRLLVADDNKVQIESILSYVKWEEYSVTEIRTAGDGEECYEIAKTFEPHIVITDIDMPNLNGIELAKKLRELDEKVALIFITCYESFQYAHEAIAVGAKAYILKPIVRKEFEDAIRKVVLDIVENEEALQQKMELINRQQEIERDFDVYSDGYDKLDVLKICDEMQALISKKQMDDIIPHFQKKYFEHDVERGCVYTKYLCYTIINALQLLSKTKGVDLENLFGTRAMWNKLSSFKNENDLIIWMTNIVRMVLMHVVETEESTYQKIVRDIKNLINNNLYEIENVEYIARKLDISSSYAQKTFKKYAGITIFDYLFEARMKEAKKLLSEPYLRIYEIAEKLGYKNKAYFSSAFQKYSGVTPNEYRKLGGGSYD